MSDGLSYEAVWNALPQPAIVFDAADAFIAVNNAAEVFFSLGFPALRGRSLCEFAARNSHFADLVAQVRNGDTSVSEYAVEFGWHDRPAQLVDLFATSMHGEPGHVLVMIRPHSITEKMDRNLAHRGAARSVLGMAAMLAHEIRNPLAGISGAAQLLEMTGEPEEIELAQLIQKESRRIGKLVDRVEQFGDSRPLSLKPVNVHDVLDQVRLSAAAGFAAHINFTREYDPSLPPIPGDRDQLMQAFLNLIKNAAEAAPATGGAISLRTAYQPGMKLSIGGGAHESLPLEITVTDNGPGVPENLAPHIFDPFVTSKAHGAGLGLALVSKVISEHGGVIECISAPGGTSFRTLLPLWNTRRRDRMQAAGDVSDVA